MSIKQVSYFVMLFIGVSFVATPCGAQDTLTNKKVVELKNAGFSSDLIIATIGKNPCKFQTDIASMMVLKKAGLDEKIIVTMMEKGAPPAASSTPEVQLKKSQNNFIGKIVESGPGIYFVDGDNTLQALEPAVFSGAKQNALASRFNGIFNAKSNASLSGEKANLQINTDAPKFYFYFSSRKGNMNDQNAWYGNASSPNQFVIFIFKIKKGQREITLGKQSSIGSTGGIEVKSQQLFKFKKLENGVYECYFENPLVGGEYGIMYGGVQQTERVYDFGIAKK